MLSMKKKTPIEKKKRTPQKNKTIPLLEKKKILKTQ